MKENVFTLINIKHQTIEFTDQLQEENEASSSILEEIGKFKFQNNLPVLCEREISCIY